MAAHAARQRVCAVGVRAVGDSRPWHADHALPSEKMSSLTTITASFSWSPGSPSQFMSPTLYAILITRSVIPLPRPKTIIVLHEQIGLLAGIDMQQDVCDSSTKL